MRIAWIALAMIVACGAWGQSQPPAPAPSKQSDPHQQQATHEQQPAAESQRGTQSAPFIVQIVDGKKGEQNTAKGEKESDGKSEMWRLTSDGWTAVFTGLLVAIGGATAIVLLRQSSLLRDQVELAREEFNATHRPKIMVRGFMMGKPDLPPGKTVDFAFACHNIGESPGTVIEVRSATTVLNVGERIRNNSGIPNPEQFDCTLASGEQNVFGGSGGVIDDSESMDIDAGTRILLCVGVVTYIDSAKIKRQTGFCRQYRSRDRTWDIVEGEYEYAY